MSESANSRAARREATAHRISLCAQRLAEEHGLDGFTMEHLAEAAGVSRRTLFNYYAGKDAAVLGSHPEFDDAVLAEFVAGRPTGDLVDDMTVLIRSLLEVKEINREDAARARRLMRSEPRLFAAARAGFDEMAEQLRDLIRQREGSAYDDLRARVVLQMIDALFEVALTLYTEGPDDADLFQLYLDALGVARQTLHPQTLHPQTLAR